MGATFAAVHVKGASADELARQVEQRLAQEGFSPVAEGEPEREMERRVLVFESGGWGVVADEDQELDPENGEALAKALSKELEKDAIAIAVFHSDVAMLACFRKGRRLGAFSVPDGAKPDEKTGHQTVAAKFLAVLARSKQARAELQGGLLADRTFPEETTARAAELVGLPHPGAGARYLWHEPPAGARRLRFAPPLREVPAPSEDAPAFDAPVELGGGHAIWLNGHQDLSLCVEMPIFEQCTITAKLRSGKPIEGLGVEIGGSALALLDVPEVAGWNPDIGSERNTEIVVAALEERGERRSARFPKSRLATEMVRSLPGPTAAQMRAWQKALEDQAKNSFVFHLRGKARAPGEGELLLRLTRLDGSALDANEMRVRVRVGRMPRVPILPEGRGAPPEEHNERRRFLAACEQHGGDDLVCGWIGFDAPWSEVGDWLVDAASRLASFCAARRPQEVSVTSAGAHPDTRGRFEKGDHLADPKKFRVALEHLANEADVHLHCPYDQLGAERSHVQVRHQPHGTTIFDAEMRARFPDQPRIVPADLQFAVSRPRDANERKELAALIAKLFEEAASRSSCVGGYAAPMGAAAWSERTVYEDLAGIRSVDSLENVRNRVRCPGWRVIAPRAAVACLAASAGVQQREVAAGALLASSAADPFSMTTEDREACERAVVAAIGKAGG